MTTAATADTSPPTGPHYRIHLHDARAHLFRVELHIPHPAPAQQLTLPVWIPGSYLVREFSKNLHSLAAHQLGQPVSATQLSKNRWQLDCSADSELVVSYLVSAYDHSVRTAWLDQCRGFFNGTSLCLRVIGQEQLGHSLSLARPTEMPSWRVATGLTTVDTDAQGWGLYGAANYDELVDCPVELGEFWRGEFSVRGVVHSFVVAGAAASFDHERLLNDTRKICETEIAFWHPDGAAPPMQRYVFMLNVVDDNYGGLEHRNSTALICGRRDLPRMGDAKASDGYITLLGLISHEYFHTWNVKRLRPASFRQYDYEQENYTELLWFFEGFTSYFDDVFVRRAGLIDDAQYLKLITRTINQVQQTPGRKLQSVAQSSFDAWVKYYRQDENTANQTVSYYTKGSMVALCLDLALRSAGRSLDELMRLLWQRSAGGPIDEDAIGAAVAELAGPQLQQRLLGWVHSTDDLPLAELLAPQGIQLRAEPAQLAQRLGLRVQETQGLQIKNVLRGGLAEQAGMMAGDEWLVTEVPGADGSQQSTGWRMQKLDDLLLYAGAAPKVIAWMARDRCMLKLELDLGALAGGKREDPGTSADEPSNFGLDVTDKDAVRRWLEAA